MTCENCVIGIDPILATPEINTGGIAIALAIVVMMILIFGRKKRPSFKRD